MGACPHSACAARRAASRGAPGKTPRPSPAKSVPAATAAVQRRSERHPRAAAPTRFQSQTCARTALELLPHTPNNASANAMLAPLKCFRAMHDAGTTRITVLHLVQRKRLTMMTVQLGSSPGRAGPRCWRSTSPCP